MQSIRVGFYTQDSTLQRLLSSGMSPEFQFFPVSDQTGINRLLSNNTCTVMIVDLSSHDVCVQQRIEEAKDLVASGMICVILADIELRLSATELVRQGAYAYSHRPPSIRDLKVLLRRANESAVLEMKLRPPSPPPAEAYDLDRMIGKSPQMQQIYQRVKSVASVEASVLITGESGTGKELAARAIHNTGSRSARPFVAVACGAIPETLIEAELFGHEKGAFTGAAGSREGYFEQARDGTLFLDEIGDLSLYTQVKLLRCLQQREFCRLGSTKVMPLRARLIFATHQDLSELVAQGKFRQDLYYRINVMGIEIPSLQERSEDIPDIAAYFLRHYSQLFGKDVYHIHPNAIALLRKYSWPGNIRELENVIQRAVIVAESDELDVDDLPVHVHEDRLFSIGSGLPVGSFERQLQDYKVKVATAAVREQNGNKTLAARKLRISRTYLHRLLRDGMSPTLKLVEDEEDVGYEADDVGLSRVATL